LVAKEEDATGSAEDNGENKVIDVTGAIEEEQAFCELHQRHYPKRYGVCPGCASLQPAAENNRPESSRSRCPGRLEDTEKVIDHNSGETNKALESEIQKKTGERETAKGQEETQPEETGEVQKPVYTVNITNLSEFIDFGVNSKTPQIKAFAGQCMEFRLFMEKELVRRNWKDGDRLPPGIKAVRMNNGGD
jgi:hypothetical protein